MAPPARLPASRRSDARLGPRRPLGAARSAGLVAALLGAACAGSAPSGLDPHASDDTTSLRQQIAASWIGRWEGHGTVVDTSGASAVDELTLRIAFDADSLRRSDCPWCVTVTLDPWFSSGNLPFDAGASASARDTVAGVIRSLDIQRFSGAGGTANTLLVALRHSPLVPAGADPTLRADLEFHRR